MITIPLAEARANLSRLVEEAMVTHERIVVTRNGRRAAVILSADDFDAIMERFPAVARATLRGVSRRLSQAQQAVHLLAGEPLEQRLAAMLLLIADKMGRPWDGGILLDVPLTREDLASMTGAAPESVSRLLSGWRREGLIDSGRRWIAVRDLKALHALRDA